MTDHELSDSGSFSRTYRTYFLILMVVIAALSVIDRTAMLTLGGAIKQDLQLSDMQFGLISGFGIAVFYGILGLPLARLADTRNRVRMVSIAVAVWSLFATLIGLSRGFLQLALCRIVVGVGEVGVQPPTMSVISDLYPPDKRGTALAVLSIGIPLGTLIGPIGSGYLADAYSWRTVFLFLGAPGLLIALIAWLTLREPPRGLSERKTAVEAAGPAPGLLAICRHLMVKPSFWHIVLAVAVTNFAAAGVGSFLPQFFSRQFSLGSGQTGLMFGVISALSTLSGTVSGGVIVDWISRRDRRWYVWLPAIGCLLAAPLYVASFVLPNAAVALVALTFAGGFLFLYYTPAQALLQNMVEPGMRATAAVVFYLLTSVLAFGVGPALLGHLSDILAAHAFDLGDYPTMCPGGVAAAGAVAGTGPACHAASATGLRLAMSIMSCLYLWAAVHFVLASRSVRGDLNPA